MAVFPSEEWLAALVEKINTSAAYAAAAPPGWRAAFVEKINSSSEYADAAATWEGDLVFVYEKEPDKGVDEDVYAWLDLWHGKCRDAARLDGPAAPRATGAAAPSRD